MIKSNISLRRWAVIVSPAFHFFGVFGLINRVDLAATVLEKYMETGRFG